MKRTMTLLFAMALLVAWVGSASAGRINNATQCTSFLGADAVHVLSFPYFPASGDWWSGMALINKTGSAIPAQTRLAGGEGLCAEIKYLSAVNATTGLFEYRTGNGSTVNATATTLWPNTALRENGMLATPLSLTGAAVVNVFANSTAVADNSAIRTGLAGFGMMGSSAQASRVGAAHGYYALAGNATRANVNGTGARVFPTVDGNMGNGTAGRPALSFDYVPETNDGWWAGYAIYSPNATEGADYTLTFDVLYDDGTSRTFSRDMEGPQALHGSMDQFDPGRTFNPNKRARIEVRSSNASLGLVGYNMFASSVSQEGFGQLGNQFEVYNGTNLVPLGPTSW